VEPKSEPKNLGELGEVALATVACARVFDARPKEILSDFQKSSTLFCHSHLLYNIKKFCRAEEDNWHLSSFDGK
jgi:hypothetical protein